MVTWKDVERVQPQSRDSLMHFFEELGGASPDSAMNLARSLIGHMRRHGWSYTTNAQSLRAALPTKRMNCDNLADLVVALYAFNNRPNSVSAKVEHVHRAHAPVFLPHAKISRTGLRIDTNVQGQLSGVFFSSGHRVASLNGICFDLITGNKGPLFRMNGAYILCTRTANPPAARYRFSYLGGDFDLTMEMGSTAQGLRKFRCSYHA